MRVVNDAVEASIFAKKGMILESKVLKTCVIGGAGFIGRFVVAELLLTGREVTVIGRSPAEKVPLLPGAVYVQVLNDESKLREVLAETDEIIDLAYATVPQTSFQDPINDILVNLPGAVCLFSIAASLPIRKFVWISSGGTVYGQTSAQQIDEDHATSPVSPYGITKLAIEKYAHLYFEISGLPIICMRPANAFGEGQRSYSGQGFIATAIASIIDGQRITQFGYNGTVRDYLHVRDIARGIVAALEHGVVGEVYNLGSGIGFTNRQILEQLQPLAAELNKEIDVMVLPERPFDVRTNVLNSNKLMLHTGWKPELSFGQALRQTWNWYVQQLTINTYQAG